MHIYIYMNGLFINLSGQKYDKLRGMGLYAHRSVSVCQNGEAEAVVCFNNYVTMHNRKQQSKMWVNSVNFLTIFISTISNNKHAFKNWN